MYQGAELVGRFGLPGASCSLPLVPRPAPRGRRAASEAFTAGACGSGTALVLQLFLQANYQLARREVAFVNVRGVRRRMGLGDDAAAGAFGQTVDASPGRRRKALALARGTGTAAACAGWEPAPARRLESPASTGACGAADGHQEPARWTGDAVLVLLSSATTIRALEIRCSSPAVAAGGTAWIGTAGTRARRWAGTRRSARRRSTAAAHRWAPSSGTRAAGCGMTRTTSPFSIGFRRHRLVAGVWRRQ